MYTKLCQAHTFECYVAPTDSAQTQPSFCWAGAAHGAFPIPLGAPVSTLQTICFWTHTHRFIKCFQFLLHFEFCRLTPAAKHRQTDRQTNKHTCRRADCHTHKYLYVNAGQDSTRPRCISYTLAGRPVWDQLPITWRRTRRRWPERRTWRHDPSAEISHQYAFVRYRATFIFA